MNCYETIDLMGEALEAGLDPESRAGFDEHLEECNPCRIYFDQLRATVLVLHRLPRPAAASDGKPDLMTAYRTECARKR